MLYDEGCDDGFEMASQKYLFDNLKSEQSDEGRKIYQVGYYAGWIEGGGGSDWERIAYWITQNLALSIISLVVILTSIIVFTVWKMRRKVLRSEHKKGLKVSSVAKAESSLARNAKQLAQIVTTMIGITVLVAIIKLVSSNEDAIPTTVINVGNPYSYTTIDHDCSDYSTQKEAQLFYEANGGPKSVPHDLDRDNDGMACDWNPR